jgi:hypothetical protein
VEIEASSRVLGTNSLAARSGPLRPRPTIPFFQSLAFPGCCQRPLLKP